MFKALTGWMPTSVRRILKLGALAGLFFIGFVWAVLGVFSPITTALLIYLLNKHGF